MKYEQWAISCDLVQVWPGGQKEKKEGLLQNMSEAVQEILRPAIDTNPHTTHFVPVLIQIISNAHYHTLLMFFEGGRALAKISRWPWLGDHLAAILTPTPLWLFFSPTFLLLFYFDNRPAHFVDLLL